MACFARLLKRAFLFHFFLFCFIFKTMQERLKGLPLSQHFKGASVLFARLFIHLPTTTPLKIKSQKMNKAPSHGNIFPV